MARANSAKASELTFMNGTDMHNSQAFKLLDTACRRTANVCFTKANSGKLYTKVAG